MPGTVLRSGRSSVYNMLSDHTSEGGSIDIYCKWPHQKAGWKVVMESGETWFLLKYGADGVRFKPASPGWLL